MQGFKQAMQSYEQQITDPYGYAELHYQDDDDIYEFTKKECTICGDTLAINTQDDTLFCMSCGYEVNNDR